MKNIYKLISIVVFSSQAQLTNLIWQKNYRGAASDIANAIVATFDGEYVMVGSTTSTTGDIPNPQGQQNIWVIKVESTGTIQWQNV